MTFRFGGRGRANVSPLYDQPARPRFECGRGTFRVPLQPTSFAW